MFNLRHSLKSLVLYYGYKTVNQNTCTRTNTSTKTSNKTGFLETTTAQLTAIMKEQPQRQGCNFVCYSDVMMHILVIRENMVNQTFETLTPNAIILYA